MKNNEEILEIEDLSIEDETEIELKTTTNNFEKSASETKEIDTSTSLQDVSNVNSDSSITNNLDSSPLVSNDKNSSETISSDAPSGSVPNDNESLSDDSFDQKNEKSFKEKLSDAKDNFNDTKKKLKEAPENIKNKANEAKEKLSDAKEKLKEAPENIKNKAKEAKDKLKEAPDNLKKKRDALKDKVKNRPSAKEMKEKAKNIGKNLKDRTKNSAKNAAKNAANRAKDGLENSDLGQKAQDLKNKYDKAKKTVGNAKKAGKAVAKAGKAAGKVVAKAAQGLAKLFISTLPWSAIVLAVVAVLALVIILIVTLSPGIGGDASDEEIYSEYSEVDQKTMSKMADLFGKYENADGTLAMATVIYPYYSTLYSGNVLAYLEKNSEETTEEDTEPDADEDDTDNFNDTDDTTDSEEDIVEDDPFLVVFRSSKIRKKLKRVLKELDSSDEEAFKEYLKSSYFPKDKGYGNYNTDVSDGYVNGYNGYKQMLKVVDSDKQDEFMNNLIEDLYDIKDNFIYYVFKNPVCSVSMVSAGQVSVDEILTKNILVDVKVESCTSATKSGINSCESKYETPISLEKYVKSVAYEEIGVSGSSPLAEVETQMVAAKSFLIGRYKSMGWELKQTEDGSYVIPIRSNTNDQDFCDIDTGCEDKINGAKRGPLDDAARAVMDQAWEASKNVYIYDSNKSTTVGAYCQNRQGVCNFCTTGSCMAHEELKNYQGVDFQSILVQFYSNFSLLNVENDLATVTVAGEKICTNADTNMTATRTKVVSFALEQVGKVPYYEGGLASVAGFEGNNFNTDIEADSAGRTKKGLNAGGFVNWTFWSSIEDNLGNTGNVDDILAQTFEITQDKLLMGDIGYSSDKAIIGIYAGENKWIFEDAVTGTVVAQPDDRFTVFARLNKFKDEMYNYQIRKERPTPNEWSKSNGTMLADSTNYIGECPWYARNRAFEIVRELKSNGSLTDSEYNFLSKRIKDTRGDGGQFFPGGVASNAGYKGSTNIDDIKAGSFLATTSSSSYGHVLVIEYANQSEDKIIVTDGYNNKRMNNLCTYENFSCAHFGYYEYTYQQFKEKYSSSFKGYLYFLQQ